MKQTRFHGQFFTIPNLLSYLRLGLIPAIVWLYCGMRSYTAAAWMMAVSAATDVVDGWIARHFDLVTDWGKIIDPIADKLTQIAICFCLAWRYIPVRFMLVLLIVKEVYMGIIGLIFIHKTDSVEGAVWYGKMTTVLFFLVALLLILFPDLPNPAVIAAVAVECASIILSMILYTARYLRLYHEKKQDPAA
ncbi:MAG: CDP-alcohol phosphatidyltransferase family protein [Clostridia bacterium]|nr:CDP-alcohol phosphatidyltransferase family protein [Clostridia bacterium]